MTDYALKFDGIQNYVSLGTMGNFGSNLGNGFYCKYNLATLKTDIRQSGNVWTGTSGSCAILVNLNENSGGGNTSGSIRFYSRDQTGKQLAGATNAASSINDGKPHTLEIIAVFSTNTITIKIDGVSKAVTYSAQQTPSSFPNFTRNYPIGARNNSGSIDYYLASTIDNFEIGTSSGILYGSYDMNDGTGTSVTDNSGNNNAGTLIKDAGAYPLWVAGIGIKTINGLAKASCKTYNSLAIASVKTINGLG